MSTTIEMYHIKNDQEAHDEEDLDNSSDIEVELEKFKLNELFSNYSLEQCLETVCFRKLIENFGTQHIAYFCEKFGVNSVNKVKQYEKNPMSFFANLLQDYAVNSLNIEQVSNKNKIACLPDLQLKLWKLNNGKLICKLIKEKENGKIEKKKGFKNKFVC